MKYKNITITFLAFTLTSIAFGQNTFPYPQSGNIGVGTTSTNDYKLTAASSLQYRFIPGPDGNPGIASGIIPFRILAEEGDPLGENGYANANNLSEARIYSYNQNPEDNIMVYSLRKDGSIFLGENINASNPYGANYSLISDKTIYSKTNIVAESKIGIGTTNPQSALDVFGNTSINNKKILLRGANDPNHYLRWGGNAPGAAFATDMPNGPVLVGYSGGILGTTNGQEKVVLRWNELGRVGINDNNPGANLSINSSQLNDLAFTVKSNANENFKVFGNGNAEATKLTSFALSEDAAILVQNTSNSNIEFKVKGNGFVYAREVQVLLGAFPDYVFSANYNLMSFENLRSFISTNKHLPGISSANEIDSEGIGLGELSRLQMEKIEELTLYILKLEERISNLENK